MACDKNLAIQNNSAFYPWSRHGAGIVMIKNNTQMMEFFDFFNRSFNQLYDRDRNSVMNTQWWIDQAIIYCLICLLKIDIFILEKVEEYIYFPKGDKDVELKKKIS